jgi:hypothetical protein
VLVKYPNRRRPKLQLCERPRSACRCETQRSTKNERWNQLAARRRPWGACGPSSMTNVGNGQTRSSRSTATCPGEMTNPTTAQVLSHKHPDDYDHVVGALADTRRTRPVFSTRHRMIDNKGGIIASLWWET